MGNRDWTNIDPSQPLPEQQTTKENTDTSVLPDPKLTPWVGAIETGPKEVFKQGYPTTKTVGSVSTGADMDALNEIRQKAIKLQMSKNVQILQPYGVADPMRIHSVLFPQGQSLLRSLADQNVFLITKSFKVVDVATHPWPIDLTAAIDVRCQLTQPVQYGDTIGIVGSQWDDERVLVQCHSPFVVALHDLSPIMLDRDTRLQLSGGKRENLRSIR